jgi:hypothetical protein
MEVSSQRYVATLTEPWMEVSGQVYVATLTED